MLWGCAEFKRTGRTLLGSKSSSEAETLDRLVPWIAAIAFQFTLTLGLSGTAIRVSLADILVPLGLLAMLSAVRCRYGLRAGFSRAIPGWSLIIWAVLTTAWLTFSLLNGRNEIGGWSGWALQNKYIGWYALLVFLFSGFAFERVFSGFATRFLTAFIVVAWGISLATILAFAVALWAQFPKVFLLGPDFRAVGMLVNPNAFGFTIAIAVLLHLSGRVPLPSAKWMRVSGLVLLLAVLVLAGSRSAWMACVVALVTMTVLQRWDWRQLIMAVPATAALLAIFLSTFPQQSVVIEGAEPNRVYAARDVVATLNHVSVSHRVEQLEGAFVLWKSAPLRGVGLGVYLDRERELGRGIPQQIHNSYLWLLAETGLVGTVLFGGLFLTLLAKSWRRRESDDLMTIGVPVLLMVAVFAVFQEALYQRHIWFFAGILFARLMLVRGQPDAPGSQAG
jgi:O-antigen ligase